MPYPTINQSGFTLIELIISMALSTIIITQVMSQLVTQSHFQYQQSQSFQADQEIRNTLEFIRMEFSRTGFINQTGGISHDDYYEIASDCLLYRYDKNIDGQLDPQEAFGLRYKNGQIQVSRNTGSCTKGYWEAITSPQSVKVLSLEVNRNEQLQECLNTSHRPVTNCNIYSCEYIPYGEHDVLLIKDVIRLAISYQIRTTREKKTQELILFSENPQLHVSSEPSAQQGLCNHA